MTLRFALLAAALALAAPAFADEPAPTPTPEQQTPAPTPDPKEQASLTSFGEQHPACVEWSDGCAVCKRAERVSCSTPGIACLPAEIVCKAP